MESPRPLPLSSWHSGPSPRRGPPHSRSPLPPLDANPACSAQAQGSSRQPPACLGHSLFLAVKDSSSSSSSSSSSGGSSGGSSGSKNGDPGTTRRIPMGLKGLPKFASSCAALEQQQQSSSSSSSPHMGLDAGEGQQGSSPTGPRASSGLSPRSSSEGSRASVRTPGGRDRAAAKGALQRNAQRNSFSSLRSFGPIHEDHELDATSFSGPQELTRGGTEVVHEDLEMRILTERLKLLGSQREFAAIRCQQFTRMLEASLSTTGVQQQQQQQQRQQTQPRSGCSSGVPSSPAGNQFLVDEDEQYWSSPNFYRGKFRGPYCPPCTVSLTTQPQGARLPLDTYFVDSQMRRSKAKLPNRHSRRQGRNGQGSQFDE